MKEKVLKALLNLGFQLEQSEIGYMFDYEGMHYLYMPNDSDEAFLSISIPMFYHHNEDNTAVCCILAESLNSELKYLKVYTLGDSLWLFYERYVFDDDDLEQLIPHMILSLDGGLKLARKRADKIEADFANDDEKDDTVEVETNDIEVVDDNEN